ncbi:hypothetical protein CJF32_00001599 [Rutstroemia sp. NJR-2017a WRK4]|nr:hypothetical protein CJF32_00001599 [Rutstroemia sp. NJR-2017a WRK4]
MADSNSQDPDKDRALRESSIFDLPQYVISYNDDHTLRWDPPAGSKELSIALSYHFPLERDLGSKMQAATRKFLRAERQKEVENPNGDALENTSTDAVRSAVDADTQVMRPSMHASESSFHMRSSSNASNRNSLPESRTIQFLTWDADMKEFSPRVKKRRYDKDERVKVAANRGFACARHRKQKMKCDPERCSRNKQRLHSLEDMASQMEDQSPLDRRHSSFVQGSEITNTSDLAHDPETLTLNSAPADPSPRWTMSSFVDPATLYKLEGLHTSVQSFDFPTPSLEYSSRSHDSIGSVLSTTSDVNFLANYDEMTFEVPTPYETYPWWPQNHLDTTVPDSNTLIDTENTMGSSNIPQDDLAHLGSPRYFRAPPEEQQGTFQWIGELSTMEHVHSQDDSSCPIRPSSSPMEKTANSASQNEPNQQGMMEWEAARPSSVAQGYYCNGGEMMPLTEEQKKTLIKWWGRDRSSEQPESIRGRQNSYGSQPSNNDPMENLQNLGKKASLRDKVKTVHVPPFPRGLFRSRSTGKEKKP